VALGLTALFAFLWAMRSGQYEDMDGAALRMLSDDDADVSPRLYFCVLTSMRRAAIPCYRRGLAVLAGTAAPFDR
jgi:cbb3-type cytochrome oxidase maturation protein